MNQPFVVVSAYFPPVVGGTSTVVSNLLSAFPVDACSVVCQTPETVAGTHNMPVRPGQRVTRTGLPQIITRIPYGFYLARWLRLAQIPCIERVIRRECRRTKASLILAVYPSWPFLIASYRVAQREKLRLATYHMDIPDGADDYDWPERPVVRHFGRKILEQADTRLVLSEALATFFQSRLGLDSVVIPHASELETVHSARLNTGNQGPRRIVHTGVVSNLQQEGLQRIANTIAQHPEWNVRLVLCTPTSPEDLRQRGFKGDHVEIVSLDKQAVTELQRSADLLLAVISFDGPFQDHQRTAFPTKTIEYLAAGVPILAHTPRDSYFAEHVLRHRYAMLADSTNPTKLAEAISRALDDVPARAELISQCGRVLESEFALSKVAGKFQAACGL